MKNRFDIKNKNIFVIGGSGQIGSSLVRYLLSQDSYVYNLDLNNIKNIKKKKYNFIKIDLSQNRQLNIFKNNFKNKKVHALINLFHYKGNSKMLEPGNSFFNFFHEYPEEEWKSTININLGALFSITKFFLNIMIKQNYGNIVNVSSTYGINSPNSSIYGNSGINSPIGYSTTKSAIINFSKYIATHYANNNIRCNTISPGGVLNKNQSEEFRKKYEALTPLGRLAKRNEYNEAFHFLISDASSYMTGSNLIIDGGWTSW